MLLQDKVAVVYGGAGSIGSALARAFAAEGATVHVTGRDKAAVDVVADEDPSRRASPPRRRRSTRSTSGPSTSTCGTSSTPRAASTSR